MPSQRGDTPSSRSATPARGSGAATLPIWQRLCELLEAPQMHSILVVGDFMIDRYLYGDAERISPEAPVPVLRVVRQEDALGGAGSVTADIAALGGKPCCVGISGDDADAGLLKDLLQRAGADSSGLMPIASRPTTRKTRLIGLAQHRHRQQLIRVDDESADPIPDDVADALLRHVANQLDQCSVACIEDYRKGVVTPRLAQGIIRACRDRGIRVLVDPANINDYSHYAGADLITPNRSETEKLIQHSLRSIDDVRGASGDILAACRTDYVCVTLDADGAALIGPGRTFEHVPTRPRDVYDVTGAGDEVLAALAIALAGGGTLREAVMLANVAGGLEVERFGCVPITRDEVIGEILLEHHRTEGKLRTVDRLLPELKRRRAKGEKVAFSNGCFDLLHAGHVACFAHCREHSDILIVGLNSDSSVRALAKGGDRPIVGQADRARVLAALADVDYVVIFDEPTPQSLIEAIRPDVLVKGEDWAGKGVAGQEFVEEYGGKLLLAPFLEGRSTSNLIRRIRESGG